MATLQFLKSNGLNNSYENTIDFDNLEAQNTFWETQILTQFEANISTSRLLAGSLYIDVGFSYSSLLNVNYLRFYQDNRYWYCFITNKIYINENNTRLEVEIDVLQTFQFDYSVGYSFIDREHQNRWNSATGGIRYNLTYENLDIGDEFVKAEQYKIYDTVPEGFEETGTYRGVNLFWAYIVAREPITTATGYNTQPTSNNGLPSNIFYYLAPIAFKPDSMIGNVSFYINKSQSFESALQTLNKEQFLELTQDPNIISISLSRYAPFEYTGKTQVNTSLQDYQYLIVPNIETLSYDLQQYKNTGLHDGGIFKLNNVKEFDKDFNTQIVKYFKDLSTLSIDNLKNINNEPKLLTNQFCRFEIEQGKVKQVLSIPQFNSDGYTMRTSYSIRQSQALMPSNYANSENFADARFKNGQDYALEIDNSDIEMPLRTDAWLSYLSQNKNSLVTGMKTQALQTLGGIVQGVAGGSFGVAQGIGSVVGAFSQVANNIAQIKDLKETPDTVSKPNIDYINNFINKDLFYIETLYKLPYDIENRVFNYLYTYGYSVKKFGTPDLRSRYYFNFIKTISSNIISELDDSFINKIAQIYDKGITIWHYRNANKWKGILNYEYENLEMSIVGGNRTNG